MCQAFLFPSCRDAELICSGPMLFQVALIIIDDLYAFSSVVKAVIPKSRYKHYFLSLTSSKNEFCLLLEELHIKATNENTLHPCYLKCDPRADRIVVTTWELVKMETLRPQPRPSESECAF